MTDKPIYKSSPVMEYEPLEIDRQKQQALSILGDVWDQASDDGLDIDCLSHAALFQAISSLVLAYGEDSVANFCKGLPERIERGDFTLLQRQLQ